MAFKTFVDLATLPASDLNTYLMKQAVIVCTSGTRPGSPVEGMTIRETDTGLRYAYDGSAWQLDGVQSVYQAWSSGGSITLTLPTITNGQRIRIYGRVTSGGTGVLLLRFNGESTAGNYAAQVVEGATTTSTIAFDPVAAGNQGISLVYAASGQAAVFDVQVPDFQRAVAKFTTGQGFSGNGTPVLDNVGGYWSGTAAIASVSVHSASGNLSSGDWLAADIGGKGL